MSKRKLNINEIKKTTLRGKKYNTIATKYEIVLSYFKQKEIKNHDIFRIDFFPLILDLFQQLNSAQFIYKIENNIKENLKPIEITSDLHKLDSMFLKYLSKEYPIQQIIECLYIKKEERNGKVILGISRNKLMVFFKNLRQIYPEFCFCQGDKIIVEPFDIKLFYENFKGQWNKNQQKGRVLQSQRLEKLISRSFYFLGLIIENNIFSEIQEQQRKKREDATEPGTKSQKKRNIRGITHQVSSTYSFNSMDILSNFSLGFKSQQSNEEDYRKGGHSEKSEKVVRKVQNRIKLGQVAELKNLKFKIYPQINDSQNENGRFQIDLLSNDVENILIEQAFKIQKFKDVCGRQQIYPSVNSPMNPYPMYQNYFNYQQPYFQNSNEDLQLHQLRRSFNLSNLVETRKTHSRLGADKYS